jgi:hypothetical protein
MSHERAIIFYTVGMAALIVVCALIVVWVA